MTDATAPATAGAKAPLFSTGYKNVVLSLLLAAYTFNFIDRTIISTIGPKIREDLGLTNTQLGLLGGLYFALLYTILGIPIARLAERFNRVRIIAVSLVIWSGFTALCGFAANFATLALYRFGVGVGEAGCSPPSHSLISDYYEPKRRATALSIYSFGIPLGAMIGAIAGGWLAQNFGWRVAFMVVGAPGLILALITWLAVREPPRGHSDIPEHPALAEDVAAEAAAAPKGSWLATEFREIGAVAKVLFGRWPILNMVLGVTIASFGSYGAGAFSPQYFYGTFALGLATVGLVIGLVGGVSSGAGTLLGGFVTDWLAKRSVRWYALTPALGLAIATPIYLFAYTRAQWQATALILLIPGIFHYTYLAPTFGVVQNAVEPRRRATATAILFFFLNFIALGGGPVFTGSLVDFYAGLHFAHPGASLFGGLGAGLLRASGDTLMAYVTLIASIGSGALAIFHHGAPAAAKAAKAASAFAAACPGGIAPKGSASEAAAVCRAALSAGTQDGILISLCFYAWAAVHYLLGSFGLAKALTAVKSGQAAEA